MTPNSEYLNQAQYTRSMGKAVNLLQVEDLVIICNILVVRDCELLREIRCLR